MKAGSLSFKTKFWIESVIKPYINFYRIDHKNEIITFYIYVDTNANADVDANTNANDATVINSNKTSINHMNTNLVSDSKANTSVNPSSDQSKNLLSFTIVKKSMHFAQANLLINMGEISERYLRLLLITYLTKSINDFRSLIKLLHIPHQTIEYKLMSPTPSSSSMSMSMSMSMSSSMSSVPVSSLTSSPVSASSLASAEITSKILQESTSASASAPILESKENQNLLTNDMMNKDSLTLQTPLSPTFGQNDEIKILV